MRLIKRLIFSQYTQWYHLMLYMTNCFTNINKILGVNIATLRMRVKVNPRQSPLERIIRDSSLTLSPPPSHKPIYPSACAIKDCFGRSVSLHSQRRYRSVPCPARLALRQADTGTPHRLRFSFTPPPPHTFF